MIISQVKFVTPEMAKEWLEKYNNVNRTLNMDRAKFYRDIILQGKWETTHQGISFFENGELCDGQHRLKGIVLANKEVEVMVTTGLKTSAALAIDNGRVRSTHDQLRIGGIGQLNNTGASILKMLATKGAAEVPNIYKLQSYYEKYSDMIIFGQSLAKGSVKKITSAPICSALAVCAHHTSEEKVMRFMEILKTGIPPEPVQKNDFMVIRFRNHLLTAKGVDSHGSASRKKLMMKVMRVYKAYVKDEDLNKFLEQSDFAYPIPE